MNTSTRSDDIIGWIIIFLIVAFAACFLFMGYGP